MLRFQRKLNFLEAISLQLAVTHACLMDGEHSLSLQRSIWFHWESSLTLILLRQLLIFLFFFFLLRKHRVLTLITNPVIWLFFSFCSMLVTLPIEILKMIWAQNTWSAQNIPFNLLPTFALVSLSYMYLGQRSKKGKGYLLISILIWRKGDWESKTPWLPFCVRICYILNVCRLSQFAEPSILDSRRNSVFLMHSLSLIPTSSCGSHWVVSGAHMCHVKDLQEKVVTFLISYCLSTQLLFRES